MKLNWQAFMLAANEYPLYFLPIPNIEEEEEEK